MSTAGAAAGARKVGGVAHIINVWFLLVMRVVWPLTDKIKRKLTT